MSKDDKLSLEEALEQQRSIGGNVVPFNAAQPNDEVPPGYEEKVRPDIEDFLDRGTNQSNDSDEPLAVYDDVKFIMTHFNRIFAKVLDGNQDRVIWERHYDNTYVIMSYETFNNRFQYSLVRIE